MTCPSERIRRYQVQDLTRSMNFVAANPRSWVNNQVQQIQTLTDQLNEFKHYESLLGDPKAVLLTTVQPLVNDLRKTEVGETLADIEGAVDAGEAIHPPQ